MKHKFATFLLGTFLALAAYANTVNLDLSGNSVFYTSDGLNRSFDDILNFTLYKSSIVEVSAGGSFTGLVLGPLALGQGLKSLNLEIFDQRYSTSLPPLVLPENSLKITVPAITLAAGSYSARVFGTAQDSLLIRDKPRYTFYLAAQPVPEPESYAMIMAGLGLVGVLARRRRTA